MGVFSVMDKSVFDDKSCSLKGYPLSNVLSDMDASITFAGQCQSKGTKEKKEGFYV